MKTGFSMTVKTKAIFWSGLLTRQKPSHCTKHNNIKQQLIHLSDLCFSSNDSFIFILVFPPARKDLLSYLITKLSPLSDSIQSRLSKLPFLRTLPSKHPIKHKPWILSNKPNSFFFIKILPSSPWCVVSAVAVNSKPNFSGLRKEGINVRKNSTILCTKWLIFSEWDVLHYILES